MIKKHCSIVFFLFVAPISTYMKMPVALFPCTDMCRFISELSFFALIPTYLVATSNGSPEYTQPDSAFGFHLLW